MLQKVLRPGKPAVSVKSAFDAPRCNTDAVRAVAARARTADRVPAGR